MAGVRKPTRKPQTTSPNVVLVVFLVIFVLSTLVLGIWLYYSGQEKDKLAADAKSAKKSLDANAAALDMYKALADQSRLAVEGPAAVSEEEKKFAALIHEEVMKEGGKFAQEKNLEAYKKLLNDYRTDLTFREASADYATSYRDKLKEAQAELKKTQALYQTAQKDLVAARQEFKTLEAKQDANWEQALKNIDKGNKDAVAEVRKQADEKNKLMEQNRELNKQIVAMTDEADKAKKVLEREIRDLKIQLAKSTDERPDAAAFARGGEPHALLLDVSPGKPLWDQPVGEITSVNLGAREATINVGSSHGVRPELTFTVFAPSKLGRRADGRMRGTLEVTRVLGSNSSTARITSLYDADGNEIPLTGFTRDRAQRESENTLREGFLLYNLFWNSHVAVAGYVPFNGSVTENPAEQMRQLNDFLYLLGRQGVQVDAYLDLTDGTVKGAITPQTRYLVRGEDLRVVATELENKDPKAERAKAVNDAALGMQKDATDKGLFVISAKNFATVIGYRRPLGTSPQERAEFRPSLPAAGTAISAQPGSAPANPFGEEKKGEEKKAAEKDAK